MDIFIITVVAAGFAQRLFAAPRQRGWYAVVVGPHPFLATSRRAFREAWSKVGAPLGRSVRTFPVRSGFSGVILMGSIPSFLSAMAEMDDEAAWRAANTAIAAAGDTTRPDDNELLSYERGGIVIHDAVELVDLRLRDNISLEAVQALRDLDVDQGFSSKGSLEWSQGHARWELVSSDVLSRSPRWQFGGRGTNGD